MTLDIRHLHYPELTGQAETSPGPTFSAVQKSRGRSTTDIENVGRMRIGRSGGVRD